jgi:hypothetical protein
MLKYNITLRGLHASIAMVQALDRGEWSASRPCRFTFRRGRCRQHYFTLREVEPGFIDRRAPSPVAVSTELCDESVFTLLRISCYGHLSSIRIPKQQIGVVLRRTTSLNADGRGSLPDPVCAYEPYCHVHGTCCVGAPGTARGLRRKIR